MIRPPTAPSAEEIAHHYDDLDPFYREIWGEHVHHGLWLSGLEPPEVAVVQMVRHVARSAGIREGSVIYDVGCGYGASARLLAEEYGARVTGITLSTVQCEWAVRRCSAPGVSFVRRDWLQEPVTPGECDAVIAIESVEHMADKPLCFRQSRRALRPGGRFVFTTWLAGDAVREWERRGLLEPICREGRLPSIGTAGEYLAELGAEDFAPVSFADLSSRVKPTWSICIRRLASRLWTDRRYRRYLTSRDSRNRAFALTLVRMWLAYETGAIRYGLFTGVASNPG